MDSKNSTVATGIIAVIVGVVIGGLVGYSAGNMKKDTNSTSGSTSSSKGSASTTTKAADARVALNNALREHVSLSSVALRAAFDGDPNTKAALATLDDNSVEVAGVVGSVYGPDAQKQFLQLWRNHIGFFADYTLAAKKGDKAGMDKAVAELANYSKDAGQFFEGANPNLPASAVMPLLKTHRDDVLAIVNAWGKKDYTGSYKAEQVARDQVGTIGDALAAGIAKQKF